MLIEEVSNDSSKRRKEFLNVRLQVFIDGDAFTLKAADRTLWHCTSFNTYLAIDVSTVGDVEAKIVPVRVIPKNQAT